MGIAMEAMRQTDTREPVKEEVVASTYPTGTAIKQLQSTTHDPFQGRRQAANKLVQAIYVLFGFFDALIAIRIALRLLGANPAARFAEWINGMTNWLAAPFAGLFRSVPLGWGALELNALVALIVYALVAMLLARIAWLALGETRTGLIAHKGYVQTHVM